MTCDKPIKSESLPRSGDRGLLACAADAELLGLVAYLCGHGYYVRSGRDVYEAIRSLPDEEELGAEQCADGVVVTHASDGWEMLIPFTAPMPPIPDVASHASGRGDAC